MEANIDIFSSDHEPEPGEPGEPGSSAPPDLGAAEEDLTTGPIERLTKTRRFGSFVTGGRVERVREMKAKAADGPTSEPMPLATQGVIAQMRRQLGRRPSTT